MLNRNVGLLLGRMELKNDFVIHSKEWDVMALIFKEWSLFFLDLNFIVLLVEIIFVNHSAQLFAIP